MFCDLQLATVENDTTEFERALLPDLKERCDEARERLIRLR
jgi:hypothetical protein